MSVLTVSILFLLALAHVDLSQSLHINPTVNNGKHQFLSSPKVPKSSRIYNAQGTATAGQFPFQAYIIADSAYLYGGALISSQYVLTSAAAIVGHFQWNVTLGMTDLNGAEPYRIQLISIVGIPYTSIPSAHSVGLIHLPQPVGNEFIRPAFLPSFSDVLNNWVGQEVTVTGFGYEGDGGPLSESLKYAVLNVITNAECQAAYGIDVTIGETDLCASGNGNPCAGDNGGPLFIDEGSLMFKIIGVHTFGSSSCVTGIPAGFFRMTTGVLSWISFETGIVIQP